MLSSLTMGTSNGVDTCSVDNDDDDRGRVTLGGDAVGDCLGVVIDDSDASFTCIAFTTLTLL